MINIITAMTKSGVIGKGNALPWHIPDELKNFRLLTQGSTVIMGSRTYESIGRPLPKRNNIVLGPSDLNIVGVVVCHAIEQALEIARSYDVPIFVIGGAHTYAQFLPLADYMYISYIKHDYSGDVFFPAVDWRTWKLVEKKDHEEFEVCIYQRR